MEPRLFVAAARAVGFVPSGEFALDDVLSCGADSMEAFLDAVQNRRDTIKRTFRASFKAGKVTFNLPDKTEKITIYEFRERWESEEWFLKNLDHPIAYLRVFLANLKLLNDGLRGQKPRIFIKRGNTEGYFIQEGDPRFDAARFQEGIAMFHKGLDFATKKAA